MITAGGVVDILRTGRFDLTTEKACQADIELHMAACLPLGVSLSREHRLAAGDIPDFLIGEGIVVEVKIRGANARDTTRQLARYAAHEAVSALIVATSKSMVLPRQIGGKSVLVVSLGRAWL